MNTATFTYDDIVLVDHNAPNEFRPGQKAWIVGVYPDRKDGEFSWLPDGVIYTIEFDDGESINANEGILRRYQGPM